VARRRTLTDATLLSPRTTAHKADAAQLIVRYAGGEEHQFDIPEERAEQMVAAVDHESGSVIVMITGEVLTPAEAASLLGMSTSRVKQLLDLGALPWIPVGRDRRVKVEDVVAFQVEQQRRAKLTPSFSTDEDLDLAANADTADVEF
jgi:excisionase family DNA binding protein